MFCLNNSKVSKIIKFLQVGDFISELNSGKFDWNSFIKFLENLPFDKDSSLDLIKNFIDPLFLVY